MLSAQVRSRGACLNCRKRKRKCDESRPHCKACIRRKVSCKGYEVELRWNEGIASRGRFTGASIPIESALAPRPRGRARDLKKQGGGTLLPPVAQSPRIDETTTPFLEVDDISLPDNGRPAYDAPWQDSPSFQCPSKSDEARFKQFLDADHLFLLSTKVEESPLRDLIPHLTNYQDALFSVCLALQVLVSTGACAEFFEYYEIALSRFKDELNRTSGKLEAGTLFAGCLLCTVGELQGQIWTLHLISLHRLLDWAGDLQQLDVLHLRLTTHLIEVMGIMDLPTFIIGRTTPVLGIWKNYRQSLSIAGDVPLTGVEPVSGLPRSLIDVFSRIDEPEAELDLWLWVGELGEYLQQQLWDAYRYAGMLRHRHLRSYQEQFYRDPRQLARLVTLPNTEYLVNRILSALSAILMGLQSDKGQGLLLRNSLLYCITAVALETAVLERFPAWRATLDELIRDSILNDATRSSVGLHNILEAARANSNGLFDIDAAAKTIHMEIALF